MSIKLMSIAWESDLPPTERFVLLCLADHADDIGRKCYPSVRRLVRRTGFSERAVQGALKRLRDRGYLETFPGCGESGTTLYKINLTPAGDAPPQEMRPAGDAPTPPQEMRETPAGDAPKPSGTVKEPSVLRESFSEFWEDFPHRHGKKTKRAKCEDKFRKAVRSGVDPGTILSAARAYQDDPDVRRGFGRMAETWLNQRGWEDEIDQPEDEDIQRWSRIAAQ